MKNIHILPTDKPSKFVKDNIRHTYYFYFDVKLKSNLTYTAQNIYITSDEEIRVGDWYINTFVSEKEQKPQTHTEKKQLINHHKDYRFKYCKKIILTTDFNLAPDVQKIDDEFLEWFVQNPSCEWVETYQFGFHDSIIKHPKKWYIDIPKKQQKQHLIDMMKKDEELGLYDIENDWDKILEEYYDQPKLNFISLNKWLKENYEIPKKKMGTKEEIKLEDIFNDEKRQGVKELIDKHKQETLEKYSERFDNDKSEIGNPETWGKRVKQETLEEVAERLYPINNTGSMFMANRDEVNNSLKQEGFIEGVKWQQERMYSEEEVLELILKSKIETSNLYYEDMKEWFEKFKKK